MEIHCNKIIKTLPFMYIFILQENIYYDPKYTVVFLLIIKFRIFSKAGKRNLEQSYFFNAISSK